MSVNSLPKFHNPESSIDLIYKLNSNGDFTYVNNVMLEFLQIEIEGLLGENFAPFIRKDKQDEILQFYKNQILNKTQATYFEVPIINTKGEELWVSQTCQLLIDRDEIVEILVVARDITKLVRTQKAALSNEEKYQSLIENIKLGLMEVDLNEKIVFVNDSFCKMTAYKAEELIGKNAKSIFLVEKDQLSAKRVDAVQKERLKGESSAYELKIKRRDGQSLWMIISGAPVKNSLGETIGSLGIHNDITSRKIQEIAVQDLLSEVEKSNQELLKQQKFLRAVNDFSAKLIDTNNINEILAEITSNTVKHFDFTDCVVYLLNKNRDLLSQVSAYGAKDNEGSLVNPIFIELGKGIVGSVAASGQPVLVKDTSKDKRYIKDLNIGLSELAVPIYSAGEVIGVIDSEHHEKAFFNEAHLETLTTIANLAGAKIKNAFSEESRLLAESALKDSELKLRTVIDSAMDAVITIDEFGRITEWNLQAQKIFGYSPDEAIDQILSELIVPKEYRAAHDRGMAHFLKTGEGPVLNKRIEIVGLNKAKEIFPIELSIVPIKSDDFYSFSAFIRDIRERKKVEEEMKMALEKEKELRALKSKFVSMTSHEFRTPLTTIKSNAELLEFQLKDLDLKKRDKINRNFERITSEIERLNILMNDILMIGRLDSGKMPFKPNPTDLNSLIQTSIDQLSEDLSKDFDIKLKVIGDQFNINIDANLYEHIISNLLNNAIKYSGTSKVIETEVHYEKNKVKICIIDHGIGISSKDQEELFVSFFRADNVGSIQGTGLGLSIVKQFVDMHQARIEVFSEVGKGSRFELTQKQLEYNLS